MWRLMPDLSMPNNCAIAFCVHQIVSSLITTCTFPSSSGRLYSKNCISLLIFLFYICVELQSIQLFHDFLFQTMALCKLFCERLLVVRHAGIKLFFGNIYIINLDVEILSGRERISFSLYLIVCDGNGKVLSSPIWWLSAISSVPVPADGL